MLFIAPVLLWTAAGLLSVGGVSWVALTSRVAVQYRGMARERYNVTACYEPAQARLSLIDAGVDDAWRFRGDLLLLGTITIAFLYKGWYRETAALWLWDLFLTSWVHRTNRQALDVVNADCAYHLTCNIGYLSTMGFVSLAVRAAMLFNVDYAAVNPANGFLINDACRALEGTRLALRSQKTSLVAVLVDMGREVLYEFSTTERYVLIALAFVFLNRPFFVRLAQGVLDAMHPPPTYDYPPPMRRTWALGDKGKRGHYRHAPYPVDVGAEAGEDEDPLYAYNE